MQAKETGKYHHGNLRQALLEAALGLLTEGGAAALTLREAARRAGVTHAAPYRHFADKNALLAAVSEEGFRLLSQEMQSQQNQHDDSVERLQALVVGCVNFATHNPTRFRVMFDPEIIALRAPLLQEAIARSFELLVGAVIACQEAKRIRTGNPHEIAYSLWALVQGLAHVSIEQFRRFTPQSSTPEPFVLRATQDYFQGLACR
jgi:AcrR family transcriptional regulator